MTEAPRHHPAEDTLLRHAAGMLPPGLAMVVATHLPFCRHCQAAIRLDEAIGGGLLAEIPPSDLAADTLTRTLARLDIPVTPAAPEPVALVEGVPLPETLRGLVRPSWRWLAPGISRMAVDVPADTRRAREHVWLLRIAPGTALPDHGHHGWEATCVLSGSFADVSGKYGPGDVAEMNEAEIHQPVAGAREACICLIAWEGRLRMRGLLARLVQPLIGV
jgi:putative transcriptional regulator